MPIIFLGALKKYLAEGVYPFHTPGHKGGRGAAPELKELLAQSLAVDLSLMAELDDLHWPRGVLKEAQQAAARLYGAERTFFAVNALPAGCRPCCWAAWSLTIP